MHEDESVVTSNPSNIGDEVNVAAAGRGESSPELAAFIDRFRTVWDGAPFTNSILKANLNQTDDVAQGTALTISAQLLGEGVRKHFLESGAEFSENVAKEVGNRLDQEVASGIKDYLESGLSVDEVLAKHQAAKDSNDSAAIANILEGYAAAALAKGDIRKGLAAIHKAQEQRGAPQSLDEGDWLPRIALARDPAGLDRASFRRSKLEESFDAALKAEGYTFDKASSGFTKGETSTSA